MREEIVVSLRRPVEKFDGICGITCNRLVVSKASWCAGLKIFLCRVVASNGPPLLNFDGRDRADAKTGEEPDISEGDGDGS